MSEDDQVGYGKPPRKHQFKKGQSGNPKGRPRKAKATLAPPTDAFSETFLEGMERPIPIRIGGSTTTISTREANIRKLSESALKGSVPASRVLLQHDREIARDKLAREEQTRREVSEYLQTARQTVYDRRDRGQPDHPGPLAFPHPEDVEIKDDEIVVNGPMSEEKARLYGALACYYFHIVKDCNPTGEPGVVPFFITGPNMESLAKSLKDKLPRRYRDPDWYDLNVKITRKDLARLFDIELYPTFPRLEAIFERMASQRFSQAN